MQCTFSLTCLNPNHMHRSLFVNCSTKNKLQLHYVDVDHEMKYIFLDSKEPIMKIHWSHPVSLPIWKM
uniref:Uncharacterized protein n=1 Tax=Anguilla anguilla TaxID=7936 RepID=A0A0E9U1G2_ANGAN